MSLNKTVKVWRKIQLSNRYCNNRSILIATYTTANIDISGTTSAPQFSILSLHKKKGYPSTQPPSHKPPEFHKSQLLRQYASILRSSPLILFFQHNNLKANEWLALRRELAQGLHAVDKRYKIESGADNNQITELAPIIKLQTVQTGIFAAALRIVDYFKKADTTAMINQQSNDNSLSSVTRQSISDSRHNTILTHTLSKAANRAVAKKSKTSHELSPLLAGPICILYFPIVSPQHLKEAISILSPSPPRFPAPRKKANPGWYDPAVQEAVQKLVLLGARVEERAYDTDGVKMIGSIEGGLEGLHGQLLALLQNIGISLTSTLGSASTNLYFTLESRKSQLKCDVDTSA